MPPPGPAAGGRTPPPPPPSPPVPAPLHHPPPYPRRRLRAGQLPHDVPVAPLQAVLAQPLVRVGGDPDVPLRDGSARAVDERLDLDAGVELGGNGHRPLPSAARGGSPPRRRGTAGHPGPGG